VSEIGGSSVIELSATRKSFHQIDSLEGDPTDCNLRHLATFREFGYHSSRLPVEFLKISGPIRRFSERMILTIRVVRAAPT
jgi:hypothetical protein